MSKTSRPEIVESRREILVGIAAVTTVVTLGRSARASAKPVGEAVSYRALSHSQVVALRVLGEALVPGSTSAGFVEYLDTQLSAKPAESLLMLKYLGVQLPYDDFYAQGLLGLNRASMSLYGKSVEQLQSAEVAALLKRLFAASLPDWGGPPAPLFYLALRADAVDATYGTEAGFGALGVPYLAHIQPPSRW